MIYIFDDRFERREKHSLDLIRLSQFARFEEITCETTDELSSLISGKLSNVTHVLLHSSYRYPSEQLDTNVVVKALNAYSKDIQIVLFSGGYNHPGISSIGETRVYSINSDVMYNNLGLFIRHLSKDPNSPIEMLLWGNSYLQNQILATQSAIIRSLCRLDLDKQINDDEKLDEIQEIVADRLRSEELIHLRDALMAILVPQKTWRQLLEDIENVITNNKLQ